LGEKKVKKKFACEIFKMLFERHVSIFFFIVFLIQGFQNVTEYSTRFGDLAQKDSGLRERGGGEGEILDPIGQSLLRDTRLKWDTTISIARSS